MAGSFCNEFHRNVNLFINIDVAFCFQLKMLKLIKINNSKGKASDTGLHVTDNVEKLANATTDNLISQKSR